MFDALTLHRRTTLLASFLCLALSSACADNPTGGGGSGEGPEGPVNQGPVLPPRMDGSATAGRDVFRFETFNNERFFTDALRLPAGMVAAGVTPRQLLALGVNIDSDMLPPAIRTGIAAGSAAILDDPAMTLAILNANAVVGIPVKDSNGDGVLNIGNGDKAGGTCAMCHTRTDENAIFSIPGGGSVGPRLDGRATHNLNFGKLIALAANSRALYPLLQLSLAANGGKSLGRAPTGLTGTSTEAQVDAYLSNPDFYPVGMFDDTFDGNGDPMHNVPLFRQDLAAPFGSEGAIARLDNFSNLVYTGLLDPTTLTTPGGRAFLNKLGGAAGNEIADTYVQVLAATGVTGYPYVTAAPSPLAGQEDAPLGIRVDNTKLINMNAYLASLPAPAGAATDATGRAVFRSTSAGCTSCHNVDQGRPVPTFIVPMKTIFPGDNPEQLATRTPPLNPVLNTAASIFDDKMAIVNASIRGDIRGTALPLLLDLAKKPVFLHDNSVPSLESLLDGSRGALAPHPFYVTTTAQRAALITYLRGLST
ncbi:MAG: hypothetical protein H0W68_11990, partial [Gemmatimonadaceae bacterium]|nr:hypothetical protein [Gemmatimonadaceae bacterium]